MIPANAYTSKNFTSMCSEKPKVKSAEYPKNKSIKWL